MREKQKLNTKYAAAEFSLEIELPVEIEGESDEISDSSDVIEISYEDISTEMGATSKTKHPVSEEMSNLPKKQKISSPELIELKDDEVEEANSSNTLPVSENSSSFFHTINPVFQECLQETSANNISKITNNLQSNDQLPDNTDKMLDQLKDTKHQEEMNLKHCSAPIIVYENRRPPRILKPKFLEKNSEKAVQKCSKAETRKKTNAFEKEAQTEENLLSLLNNNYRSIETLSNLIIFKKPYLYTGLYGNVIAEFVNLLIKRCGTSSNNILMTLMKIRQDDSFGMLQDFFDFSRNNVEETFQKTVKKMANFLKVSILYREEEYDSSVQVNSCKKKIHSVIDYYEIKVHKSDDWLHNNCQSVKFLVSVSSEGVINFVSSGYCQKVTDLSVLINSHYLEKLQEGTAVIANRHFYAIDEAIRKKHCMFIQSDSGHEKFPGISAEKVEIYRERLNAIFENLREFEYIGQRACIAEEELDFLHDIVIIASAVVNACKHDFLA